MNLLDTLAESFNRAIASLVDAIPTVLGALVILLVGWLVGRLVGGIVTSLLGRANADHWFSRYAGTVYGDATGAIAPSKLLGTLAKWFIYLVFFIAAANFLGWAQVSLLLNDFIAWLPNLVVAIIILVVAPVIGRLLRIAIMASSRGMGMGSAALLGRLAEFAVIAFAVIVALYQVGIASDLIATLFTGLVLALALAFGLAFGLGGRDVAADITKAMYETSKTASKAVSASAEANTPPPPSTPATPPPAPGGPPAG
jgi:hypothetical protein